MVTLDGNKSVVLGKGPKLSFNWEIWVLGVYFRKESHKSHKKSRQI